MKADTIIAKIMEDARQSASQTMTDAQARCELLHEEHAKAVQAQLESAMAQARKDCAELRDRMLRVAELDQRKEQLAMKRSVIDAVFDEALANMRRMSPDTARRFIEKLILESAEGGESVVVSEEDKDVFGAEFIAEINGKLAAAGKAEICLAGETRQLGGGVLLSRGGMEINLTYSAVLREQRPALEAEVAAMLFD